MLFHTSFDDVKHEYYITIDISAISNQQQKYVFAYTVAI